MPFGDGTGPWWSKINNQSTITKENLQQEQKLVTNFIPIACRMRGGMGRGLDMGRGRRFGRRWGNSPMPSRNTYCHGYGHSR